MNERENRTFESDIAQLICVLANWLEGVIVWFTEWRSSFTWRGAFIVIAVVFVTIAVVVGLGFIAKFSDKW